METRAASTRGAHLSRWVETRITSLLDLLAPDRCVACGAPIERPADRPAAYPAGACPTCWGTVAPAGDFCLDCPGGEARRRCGREGHLRLAAAVQYGETVAALVRATKYERNPALLHCWEELWRAARPWEPGHGSPATLLVPIPPHPARVRERGFDLTAEWCARLSSQERRPAAAALRRRRATPPQVGRDRRRRARNLEAAFAPGPAAGLVAGRRLALVDDVVTTGATAREAAAALRRLGARAVGVWALAFEPLE